MTKNKTRMMRKTELFCNRKSSTMPQTHSANFEAASTHHQQHQPYHPYMHSLPQFICPLSLHHQHPAAQQLLQQQLLW